MVRFPFENGTLESRTCYKQYGAKFNPSLINRSNKMPALLALRVMLGLIHFFQLYASPIDKTILANGIV